MTTPRNRAQSVAIAAFERAKEQVFEVTQAEMVKVARQRGITRMVFGPYDSVFFRGDKEVKCAAILDLENRFNEVHRQGFLDIWTAEDGWRWSA